MNTRRVTRRVENLFDAEPVKTLNAEPVEGLIASAFDIESPVPASIRDIDEGDSKYNRMNTAYLVYLENKQETKCGRDLLEDAGIRKTWRTVLIDWLRDISLKLNLLSDTFYQTVGIFDRYCDNTENKIEKRKVQLVGIMALFLAAKYEEIYPPALEDLANLCDGAYHEAEMLKFEIEMLSTLSFDMSQPYALQFLRRFATVKKTALTGECYDGAKYLLDLSVLDIELIGLPFSMIAASAFYVSMALHQPELKWDDQMVYWTQCEVADLEPVARRLVEIAELAHATSDRKPFGKSRSRHYQGSQMFTAENLKKLNI